MAFISLKTGAAVDHTDQEGMDLPLKNLDRKRCETAVASCVRARFGVYLYVSLRGYSKDLLLISVGK